MGSAGVTERAGVGRIMSCLTVYYDAHCPFCVRCRDWLASEEALAPLDLVPADSPAAIERVGGLPWLGAHLVVADESGRFWAGSAAFIVCLWALRRTRGISFWLAEPWLTPLTRVFFDLSSSKRGWLSSVFAAEECAGGCRVPPRQAYR